MAIHQCTQSQRTTGLRRVSPLEHHGRLERSCASACVGYDNAPNDTGPASGSTLGCAVLDHRERTVHRIELIRRQQRAYEHGDGCRAGGLTRDPHRPELATRQGKPARFSAAVKGRFHVVHDIPDVDAEPMSGDEQIDHRAHPRARGVFTSGRRGE